MQPHPPRRLLVRAVPMILAAGMLLAAGALLAVRALDGDARPVPGLSAIGATLEPRLDRCGAITDADGLAACLEEAYGSVIGDSTDVDRRIPVIDRIATRHSEATNGTCHNVMHAVGRAYAHRMQIQLADLQRVLPRDRSPNCSAGFAHGVLTQLGPEVNHADPARVRAECYRAGSRARRLGCIHGLGHAYLRTAPTVHYALGRCARLGTQDDLDCAQGVFHDYWFAAEGVDGANPAVVQDANPLKLCPAVAPRFRNACWFRGGRMLADVPPLASARDVTAACQDLAAERRRGCILMLAGRVRTTDDVERGRILQLRECGRLPTAADARACAQGISIYEDIIRVGPRRAIPLLNACATFPPDARTPCATHISRSLAALAAWDVAAMCRRTAPAVRDGCRQGVQGVAAAIGNLG